MKVLGIDASLRGTGLGVIEQQGSKTVSRHWEVVKIPAKAPHSECLRAIRERLDAVLANEGEPDVVQLSGGEPTIHPEFFAILAAARARPIKHLMINTNGVRIAQDFEFVEHWPPAACTVWKFICNLIRWIIRSRKPCAAPI